MSNFACTNCGKSISPAASYGTHDSGPMCLACYSSPPQKWASLEESWASLMARLSDWTARASVAEHGIKLAGAEIAALTKQVEVLALLVDIYKPIIDALPPCSKHGAGCVCQAKLWIDRAKAVMRED